MESHLFLASAIEPLGLTTQFRYDIHGNKISVLDPARSPSTCRSNALGLLVESTDAKGQVTQMTYDVLGSMLSRINCSGHLWSDCSN